MEKFYYFLVIILLFVLTPHVSSYDDGPYSFNIISSLKATGDVSIVASSESKIEHMSDALKTSAYEVLRVTAQSASFQKESDGTTTEWYQLNAKPGITTSRTGVETNRISGFGTAEEYRYRLYTMFDSTHLMDARSGLMGIMVMSPDGNAFSVDSVGRGLQTMFGTTSFSDDTKQYITSEFNTLFTNLDSDEINFKQGIIAQLNKQFATNTTSAPQSIFLSQN